MDKLLYFPYISIPDTEWTIQSLLYWDKVASIIPFEFMQNPEQLSSFTKTLLKEELLTQIYPEEHTYQIKNFTPNFIKYVNNELQKNIIPVSHDLNYFSEHLNRYQKIHMVKMEDIGEELIELGLAIKDDRWYYVEKSIAKAFMTYLAILLAKRTDHVAATDRFNGLSSLLDQHIHNPYKVYNESRNKLRIQILKDILPVPHQINDVYSIFKLKDRYSDELIRFRNHIEKNIMDIQRAPRDQQEERKKIFIQDSKLEIEDIKDKMRSSGFGSIVVGSLGATSSAYEIVNGIVNKNPAESIIGITGLLSTIIATIRESKDGADKSNPLAYVALTAKKISPS